MASVLHNPTFKRPRAAPPPVHGSRSPLRPVIEPLSPRQPMILEPRFNYPAINDNIDFTVQPDAPYVSTPRARAYSTSHKSTHQRTPSTIDTLAEAALAASPSYRDGPPRHPVFAPHTYAQQNTQQPTHGGNEPPHKRARSELLPSPSVERYASRPATSYEPGQIWSGNVQPGQAYHSRVEEAALLLNLKSGGGSSIPSTNFAPPPAPVARPHANSFPQDAFQARPPEVMMQPPHALLPPFQSQNIYQAALSLPSPQQTIDDEDLRPQFSPITPTGEVEMPDVKLTEHVESGKIQVIQTQTPPDEVSSPAPSVDAVMSEAATSEILDAPKRRGWSKGKPRGANARKTMAEKAASKRAASRKKVSDTRSSKRKSQTNASCPTTAWTKRRNSLSDAFVFGEQDPGSKGPSASGRARSVPIDTPMLIRKAQLSKVLRRKVKPETTCAGCEIARETTTSHGELDEWISCNGCKKWFHFDCAGFKKAHEVRDVDKFFCTACEVEHGKTTYVRKSTRAHASVDYAELQRGVLKTSEESVEHHYIQPIKDGTFTFDEETFPRVRPEMVTKEFFERSGTFVEPLCIPAEWNPRPWLESSDTTFDDSVAHPSEHEDDAMVIPHVESFEFNNVADLGQDRLDMVMPEGLTVRHVCNLVGPDWPIDVIDVKTQNSGAKWTLSRWADYYEEVGEEKAIRNVISLEVSQTKLGRLLQRPKVVRDIDLQDDVWPQEEIEKGKFPKVQFYCLMSVADSYTDFHIDFGGSSVYYHILKGKKTFFFIPPKPKHLKAYEEWNDSPQQNYTFLPSITKECYRVDLSEGDTMLIPSGWIHAVWTPEDSLVIGGNFLNRMSYKNQFRVVEIEKVNETPMKFRYPFFQKIMWYTVIKYLEEDPLPDAVSQMFYEGRKFDRDVPIWADFDGEIAAADVRPGAQNARFYSQAEVEGLPDLVNYIFRTVMLVTGRIEGTTADRMKRVNASIPKGHGEPLDLAKTFALWVAWKRGNEDPPAWAHPDAVLPSSKEEGPPKKLSERKLKELERKEAIAAWRVAPDRQSARVMTKIAKDAAVTDVQMQDETSMSYHPTQPEVPAPGPAFIMTDASGRFVSTPKTSVLGPKRVACDACRKRRIRCKHKDMVLQATPNSRSSFDGSISASQIQNTSEVHDNITVTPTKLREPVDQMDVMNAQQHDYYAPEHHVYDEASFDGTPHTNGTGVQPIATGYMDPGVPMAINGVPMFNDVPKRGRSKACYECRKSKRRCIHDEHGNVDPVKASETPVPRGSIAAKKRPLAEDGGTLSTSKKQKFEHDLHPLHQAMAPMMQGHGILKPQNFGKSNSKTTDTPSQNLAHNVGPHSFPHIDPDLFSMYPDQRNGVSYGGEAYLYHNSEQAPSLGRSSETYTGPSLEQIANEVLVDLNGNEFPDPAAAIAQSHDVRHARPPMPNGVPKTEESVDSAVSLPSSEGSEQKSPDSAMTNDSAAFNDNDADSRLATAFVEPHPMTTQSGMDIDMSLPNHMSSVDATATQQVLSERQTNGAGSPSHNHALATLSKSSQLSREEPLMPNGVSAHHDNTLSIGKHAGTERKSDSLLPMSNLDMDTSKLNVGLGETHNVAASSVAVAEADMQSLELAKMLQQEELGLRRRSK